MGTNRGNWRSAARKVGILLGLGLLLTPSLAFGAANSAARWIWYPEDANTEALDASRYLRRAFTLPEKPKGAELWIPADDRGEYWINGRPLEESDARQGGCTGYYVTDKLDVGGNVLAVKAYNATNVAGVIGRLTVAFENAPQNEIFTDASWKTAREPVEGWTEAGFDDSSWAQARDLGDAFMGPWCDYAAYDTTVLVSDAERAARQTAIEDMLTLPESLASQTPARATISHVDGSAVVTINGVKRPAVFYRATIDPLSDHGRRQIRNFAEAGVHMFVPHLRADKCWPAPGQYDFSAVDTCIRAYLSADPDAYIVPIIRIIPPGWWMETHPTEWVQYAKTDVLDSTDEARNVKRASLASEVWLEDTCAFWRALIHHVERQPWGKRVIGWHPGYGIYAEWHYFGSWTDQMPDTGEAMTSRFREWARAKYGADAALHEAWGDAGVSLDAVTVPGVSPREDGSLFSFRDPKRERWVMDYYRCQQEVTADCLEALGHIAKEESGGRCFHGAYYGYFFGVRPQTQGGHLEIERLLASDNMDYFVAPFDYEHRLMGEDGRLRAGAESYRLGGKPHIIEADIRTYLHTRDEYGRTQNAAESLAAIRREFSTALTESAAFWFVDFGPDGRGGWFDSPEILDEIKGLVGLAEKTIAQPRRRTAEIALVVDLESGYCLTDTEGMRTTHRFVTSVTTELHHIGAPFDVIFLSQLDRAEIERYKLLVFLNTFMFDEDQTAVVEQLRKAGRHTFLWLWAPGLLTAYGMDPAQASRVTGFDLELTPKRVPGTIQITAESPLTKDIPETQVTLLANTRSKPLESITDASNWYNPRDEETMEKWFRVYDIREEEGCICWTFDTDYAWNDVHAHVTADKCDGLAIDLRPRGRWDTLQFRLVVKDANLEEFSAPLDTFSDNDWVTKQYAMSAFTKAPWSKGKSDSPLWPLRGIKLVLYGTAGVGRFDFGVRRFSQVFGEPNVESQIRFGDGMPFGPVLVPKDGRPVGVAAGTNLCLLATKADGRSVFLGAPFAPRELLAALAGIAGVHLYSDLHEDVVRGNSGLLVIHTKDGGPREIHLPYPATITDAQTGEAIGAGLTIKTILPPTSTNIWTLSPGLSSES